MKSIDKKILGVVSNNEILFQSILDKLNLYLDIVIDDLSEVDVRSFEYEIGFIAYLRDLSKKAVL